MGFLSLYNRAKTLNEAKELVSFDTYDSYEQAALEKVFNDMSYEGQKYRDSLGYGGKYPEEEKMKGYRDKGSNPVRLATSTHDFGKLMYRYTWCLDNWPTAAEAYKLRIFELIKEKWPEKINRYIQEQKDNEEKTRKFEADVNAADTDKYAPTERDWNKMIDYMNKKSNPARLADSCKDANKVISRFAIAKALHWDECVKEFKRRAKDLNIATDAELEAYARKYADTNIPAQWQEYIDMLKETDTKGGIARHEENKESGNIPDALEKALENNAEVADYEVIPGKYMCRIVRYDNDDLYIKWNMYKVSTRLAKVNDKIFGIVYKSGYSFVRKTYGYMALKVFKNIDDANNGYRNYTRYVAMAMKDVEDMVNAIVSEKQ